MLAKHVWSAATFIFDIDWRMHHRCHVARG